MPDAYNSIIGFLIVTAVLSLIFLKKKNTSWKGSLIDKKHKEIYDEDGENSVDRWILIFETESGKKKKVSVKKEEFDQAVVGEKYEKKKGSFTPIKI